MKRVLLATTALIAAAASAFAADFPGRAAPQAIAALPAFTWTGFYVGANAGYLWSDSDATLAAVGGAVLPIDAAQGTIPGKLKLGNDSVLGGVQAGYNVQFGMFVTGVEADIAWTDANATATYSALDRFAFPGLRTDTVMRSELGWLGTLRARAGVAFDRALVYATGGAAFGEVKNAFAINIPALGYFSPIWTHSDTEWGWALGGGVEYALTRNISVKGEYLHYDLGSRTIHGTDPAVFPGESVDYKFKNNGNVARGGINFRF